MKTIDIETIRSALKAVNYPGFSRDIISFGLVKDICIEDSGVVNVDIVVSTTDASIPSAIHESVKMKLAEIGVVECAVNVELTRPAAPEASQAAAIRPEMPESLKNVKHIIAVASGKGGVGKSTFAVNLACALEKLIGGQGKPSAIGLLDCDIYGPTTPLMLGVNQRPVIEGEKIIPVENFGVHVMSMGFLIDEDAPVVWRGPMVNKAIQQFIGDVNWGDLEVLVVDLPPGTGDAHLTLVQTLPLSGAVIVTTPQGVAVNVATRGARMFEKMQILILGVVENMSYIEDADSGERNYILGQGGGQQTAEMLQAPFLGEMVMDARIREGGDQGLPVVVSHPDCEASKTFQKIASDIFGHLTN